MGQCTQWRTEQKRTTSIIDKKMHRTRTYWNNKNLKMEKTCYNC